MRWLQHLIVQATERKAKRKANYWVVEIAYAKTRGVKKAKVGHFLVGARIQCELNSRRLRCSYVYTPPKEIQRSLQKHEFRRLARKNSSIF